MSEAVDLAVRLNILKRGLPPRELQTAAMLLLSDVAQAAEAAPDPVSGVSVIHNIAAIACKHFAERRTDTAKPPYTEFGKGNTNYDEFGQGAANYDLHEHLMRQLAGQSEQEVRWLKSRASTTRRPQTQARRLDRRSACFCNSPPSSRATTGSRNVPRRSRSSRKETRLE